MEIDRDRILNAITDTSLEIRWKHQRLENLSDEELTELVLEMLGEGVRAIHKRLFG